MSDLDYAEIKRVVMDAMSRSIARSRSLWFSPLCRAMSSLLLTLRWRTMAKLYRSSSMVAKRKQEPRSTSGLTDPDRKKLEIALRRLEALSGHGAFGWSERHAVAETATAIKRRLDPPSVEKLLAEADRLCSPLENTLRDYQAWAEAQAVVG